MTSPPLTTPVEAGADRALLDALFAAAKKSGVVWVDGRPTWLLWHDGAVHVARADAGPHPATVRVAVPAPSTRALAATFTADVRLVEGTALDEVLTLLQAKRLNGAGPLGDVLRLEPRYPVERA